MFDVNEILKATGGNLSGVKSNISVQGISIDSRTIRPQEAFLAIKGNNFDGHNFIAEAIKKGANCIIAMPSKAKQEFKSVPFIEVKDTIKALGDIARYRRKKFNIPVIAITGSNGKTTTKEMAAWILAERFKVLKNEGTKNNQIGLPLTLLNLDSTYGIVVLEIGTNHFGEVAYLSKICQPNIGIITDIGPAHLEYLRNLEGVFKEKRALIENLAKPCLAILNADNVWLKEELAKNYKRPVTFGFAIENQSDLFASSIRSFNGKLAFSVSAGLSTEKRKSKVKQEYKITLKTPGYYNIYNALAAILACRILGIEYRDIISRLNNFDFPPSRLNLIKLNKVKFIDDTYNSNPSSLRQALNTLGNFRIKGRKILVMGDMLELGRMKEQFHYQAGKDIKGVCDIFIAVGALSRLAADTAKSFGFDAKNVFSCSTSLEARDILFNEISPTKDDVVLVKGSRLMKMEEIIK